MIVDCFPKSPVSNPGIRWTRIHSHPGKCCPDDEKSRGHSGADRHDLDKQSQIMAQLLISRLKFDRAL